MIGSLDFVLNPRVAQLNDYFLMDGIHAKELLDLSCDRGFNSHYI
jgi:hypothetical protein